MAHADNFEQLLEFSKFNLAFRGIERSVVSPGMDRFENDAEHSYQLALTAWYLVEKLGLELDRGKLIAYAIAHDLIEVYAGDTPAFSRNADYKSSKADREAEAVRKIELQFGDFRGLHTIIGGYEKQLDVEAQFVYALDKLLPVINGYMDGGRQWKGRLTLEQVVAEKEHKIRVSEPVYDLWLTIKSRLAEKEADLFGS